MMVVRACFNRLICFYFPMLILSVAVKLDFQCLCLTKYMTNGRDFPGGPVVRTLPSSAGGTVSVPRRELRSHVSQPKVQNVKTAAIL